MSVSSVTNLAIARRDDALGSADVPRTLAQMSVAAADKPGTESTTTSALKAIATYVPTEVIALYLAALAAVRSGLNPKGPVLTSAGQTGAATAVSQSEVATFIIFAFLTAFVVWLVYAGKVKTAGSQIPISPRKWPVWEMLASTIAFSAWAFGMPDSPFTRYSWYSLAWAAFVVLAVSTAIGLLAPLFQRKLKS